MPTKLRNAIQYSAVAVLIAASGVAGWYCSSLVQPHRQAQQMTPVELPDPTWTLPLPEQMNHGTRQREARADTKSRRLPQAIPGVLPMPVSGQLY